jgi:hypothetical protein
MVLFLNEIFTFSGDTEPPKISTLIIKQLTFKVMANFIEVGHSKNVANFEDLISFCIAYGTTFNPASSNITIAALQAKHSAAIADIQAVKTAKTALDNSTNAREILFKDFKKLATRIINSLSAVSPAKQTIDDAKTINNKIQGKRATGNKKVKPADGPLPSDTPADAPDSSISVSQQSYDSLMDHFAKLIETVTQEPLYAPNEADLSVTGLNTLLTQMQTANTGVINATTAFSNARITRDKTLYLESSGLVKLAFDVKMYVKSLFGASSAEFKQVSKLKFSKIIS